MVSYKNIIFLWLSLWAIKAYNQNAPIDILVKTKIDTTKIIIDSTSKARINALTAKDSAFGAKAKKVVPKRLYELIFRDIYNSNVSVGQVSKIEQNPYVAYKGKWIHKIYIHPLNVFGHSVYDTTRKPKTWTEKAGNYLHTTTKENTIRKNFLFFEEGDVIDPEQLKDNERYLRQQGIFHDARIIIVSYHAAKDAVDIHLFVQDVWSLIPSGSVSAVDNFSIGIEQKNFLGRSHSFKNTIAYNAKEPRQKIEFTSRYLIPSFGKSYISGEAILNAQRDQHQLIFRTFKPFLTPQTKYAGSAELGYHQLRLFELVKDSTGRSVRNFFWSQYSLFDAWIGRSFKLFFGSEALKERARFVLSSRYTRQTFYFRQKTVTDSTNQLFQNIRPTLFSIGYSNRRYYRDLLIYGFGRTEDVPVGELATFVYGTDAAELGKRKYIGFKFAKSRYVKTGYWYGLFNAGSYIKNGKTEQGVISTEHNYFTPLHKLSGNWYARHFFNVRLAIGINRFQNEYLNISGIDGIQSPFSDELRGTRKLILGAESVFFSPINILGFRLAPYGFINVGWAWFQNQKMIQTPLYQGYGIGFRVRNENLTFNTFQIKFIYFNNIPFLTNPFRAGFEGIPPLRFRDFDISAPEVVTFR